MAERIPTPTHATGPFWVFNSQGLELVNFILLVHNLAFAADAIKGLLKEDLPESEDWRRRLGEGLAVSEAMAGYTPLMHRLLVSSQVDNFLVYLADLLALIFRTRPETLRSSETVRLDVVLHHQTMDDLIADLAERRVHQLSYQGMQDLNQYVADRLGFELFTTDETLSHAVRLIEIRNLFVHNRGVVNRAFASRAPDFKTQLGQRIELEFNFSTVEGRFLFNSAVDIDQRAADKFGLPKRERGCVP